MVAPFIYMCVCVCVWSKESSQNISTNEKYMRAVLTCENFKLSIHHPGVKLLFYV